MSETTQFVPGLEIRLHTVLQAPITRTPPASVVEARFIPAVPAQRKVSSLTVIAVTEARASNPVPSERGITVRHLNMCEETLGDVDRVIEDIEATSSCVNERIER